MTIHNYINAVRPFLVSELSHNEDKINWESLNTAKVTAFVVARTPSQARSLASTTVTALRSFLGYLYIEGLTKQQLTAAVPMVAGWRLAALPKTLQPRQVQAKLEACDRRTRIGRRARLSYPNVQYTFQVLVHRAGLAPRSPGCRPRVHDLRHRFAIETRLDAYRRGEDAEARLTILSTYLGHVNPNTTYWY